MSFPPAAGQTHVEPLHVALPLHVVVHAPQCVLVVFRSTHVPLQSVSPSGQPQRPATQIPPVAQTLVHDPQCAAVDVTSTHEPPQSNDPIGQLHVPPMHEPPVAHA